MYCLTILIGLTFAQDSSNASWSVCCSKKKNSLRYTREGKYFNKIIFSHDKIEPGDCT